jgi:hypothetical protein
MKSPQQRVLAGEALARAARPGQLDLVAQHAEQALVLPGLLDEVLRAAPHRRDGHVDRRPGGHHHDRQAGIALAQAV